MSDKAGEHNIRVHCPTHKVSFEVLTAGRIVCPADMHELAEDFPVEGFWEYCCDCQRFWPSGLRHGGQGSSHCATCERLIARRYLCPHCKVLSVESDDGDVKRKGYTIDASGRVGAACPGCRDMTDGVPAYTHNCPTAAINFTTGRSVCPFCDEPLEPAAAGQPSTQQFPVTVEEYLRSLQGREVFAKYDYLRGFFVKDAKDGFANFALVHEWSVPGGLLYLIPRLTRFQTKQDFYSHYEQFYECEKPMAGILWIIEPAVVDKVVGGWRLREKGVLGIDLHAATPTPPPVVAKKTKEPVANGNARQVAAVVSVPSETPTPRSSGVTAPKTHIKIPPDVPAIIGAPTKRAVSKGRIGKRNTTFGGVTKVLGLSIVAISLAALVMFLVNRLPSKRIGTENVNAPSGANVAAVNSGTAAVNSGMPAAPQFTENNPPPGMVHITGGEFRMGGGSDVFEQPAHTVTVAPFFMDIYEVTCEAYAEFVRATGHRSPPSWVNGNYPEGWARRPVTGVDWDDASAYASWAHKRLPTEAEWEFAARGTDGRRYPWGNKWRADLANVNGARGSLVDVGAYQSTSPFGLYDMVGNAWEWTATDFDMYPGGDATLMRKVKAGKVIRGGCYESTPGGATTTYRGSWPPRNEDYTQTGFRCAMDVNATAR